MDRNERLLAIFSLLQSRNSVSGTELARTLNISVKTVHRDIETLSEAGIPVSTATRGGYSLTRTIEKAPLLFSENEATAISICRPCIERLTDPTLRRAALSGLYKIRAYLNQSSRQLVDSLCGMEFGLSRGEENTHDMVLNIQKAIINRIVLEISVNGMQPGQRFVEPLGLVYKNGSWQMAAWCRMARDHQIFSLDAVTGVQFLKETFRRHPGFSVADFFCRQRGLEKVHHVVLRAHPAAAETIRKKHSLGFVKQKELKDLIEITFVAEDDAMLLPWILSFGAAVKVLRPASLQRCIAGICKNVSGSYSDTKNSDSATP